ncbi:MAG: homogentisate 1,2-dioxygenase [Pseudomonadota bacterium]
MSKRNWIPVRGAQGEHSRQAHADLPKGTYEREVSKEGFFGPAAFLYHRRPPTGWTSFEGPLRPRAFDLNGLNEAAPSPWDAPVVLHNAACEMRFWKLNAPMPALARNADGDQLLFVHAGQGDLFCDYGRIAYVAGDYLYLPRGTMWRLSPSEPTAILTIQATNGHFTLPDKGLLGPHALFDPAMLDTPQMDDAFRAHQADDGETAVHIKKRGQVSVATFPHNPLDAVGWHGELAPVRINVKDFRPVVSARYHLPPSVHTTFLAERFVVCTFAPRPFETDPGAIKIPFFHNNDDFDEVLFYHAGDFFSRDGIDAGMMTFHPSGFTHGPHPKALTKMLVQDKVATDEYAVMIDTRDPLEVGDGAASVENDAYVDSWKARG